MVIIAQKVKRQHSIWTLDLQKNIPVLRSAFSIFLQFKSNLKVIKNSLIRLPKMCNVMDYVTSYYFICYLESVIDYTKYNKM